MDDRAADITPLQTIMAHLRDRERGCPWDVEQTFATIAPYTIEEAYEVADAIERDDMASLKDELGDLLFQVMFHSRMAQEVGAFDLSDVITAICDKMVRRHPHVFGNGEASPGWEQIKAAERAEKLQKRAARVGFDWDDIADVRAKLFEEIAEVDAAETPEQVEDEIGDVLYAAVNLARHHQVDPESALRAANAKFERRFRAMEALAGDRFPSLPLDEKEALWQTVKRAEREASAAR